MSALHHPRTAMIRISLSYFVQVSSRLDSIERIPQQDTTFEAIFIDVINAQAAIDELYAGLYGPYLRVSLQYSRPLLASLKALSEPKFDMNRKIAIYEIAAIQQQYNQFKTALLGELSVMDSYFVTQKGGFDTISLLMFGENLFPPTVLSKVPEALADIREAGKCLAYDLPTSAGFHIFRAVESVLRKYHDHVTKGTASPKMRNMGVYIRSLITSGKSDLKVIAALQQMKDLHRNPVSHPEAILTPDEAVAILGIARSVMTPMLDSLPPLAPTTSAPAVVSTLPSAT